MKKSSRPKEFPFCCKCYICGNDGEKNCPLYKAEQKLKHIKQSVSVEKILRFLYVHIDEKEDWGEWCNRVAENISESIIGK